MFHSVPSPASSWSHGSQRANKEARLGNPAHLPLFPLLITSEEVVRENREGLESDLSGKAADECEGDAGECGFREERGTNCSVPRGAGTGRVNAPKLD